MRLAKIIRKNGAALSACLSCNRSSWTCRRVCRLLFCCAFACLWLALLLSPATPPLAIRRDRNCSLSLWSTSLDAGFEGFDNETGVQRGPFIVPNHVHFLRMGAALANVSFMEAVCLLAAFKNQKPGKLHIHTDLPASHGNPHFVGKYWERLMRVPGFAQALEFHRVDRIDSIFGQPIHNSYAPWHRGDITRIRILQRYGGIVVDNDVYVVRSLDEFRRYEMTLEYPDWATIGMQVLVGHGDARFLKLWLDGYREFKDDSWYYNAGVKPRQQVLNARPELVHAVRGPFGTNDIRQQMYLDKWKDWKSLYTYHLRLRFTFEMKLFRMPNPLNLKYPVVFDDENILAYNVTVLDMVLDCCRELFKQRRPG